jgi:prefoldin subunit 5
MDFRTVQLAFQDGTIFDADLKTLQSYRHAVNQQPPHVDPRYNQIAKTIEDLIKQAQNQQRHGQLAAEVKIVHEEVSGVGCEVSRIRTDISHIQAALKTLEKSHRVHLRILVVAIVTAVLAAIAALDAVLKWLGGR